jgi:hypothetical protein
MWIRIFERLGKRGKIAAIIAVLILLAVGIVLIRNS